MQNRHKENNLTTVTQGDAFLTSPHFTKLYKLHRLAAFIDKNTKYIKAT